MIFLCLIAFLGFYISSVLADASVVTVCVSTSRFSAGDVTGVLLTSCTQVYSYIWQGSVCQDVSFATQSYTSVLTTYWDDSTSSSLTDTSFLTVSYPLFVPGGPTLFSDCIDLMTLTKNPSYTVLPTSIMTSYFVTSFLPVPVVTSTASATETVTETAEASTATLYETITETPDEDCTAVATVTESITYTVGSDDVVTIYTDGPIEGTSTYLTCA